MDFDYNKNTIVRHLAGSHAYGTNIPSSDVDIRGIFVAPERYIRTPFFNVTEVEVTEEEDTKLFELTNFMKLYLDMNPNIIETLWVHDDDITYRTDVYDHLRNHRSKLMSTKAAFTFSGYAYEQLKRIKGHNKWLSNPQSEQAPRQIDYVSLVHNLTDRKMFKINMEGFRNGWRLIHYGGDIYGMYPEAGKQTYDHLYTLNTNQEDDLTGFYTKKQTLSDHIMGFITGNPEYGSRKLPHFIVQFHREQYKAAKTKWKQYWDWVRNRNDVRSELEQQHGYDTKHAMHLVRLLRMGEEILTSGEVQVKRPDADELLSIRNGSWTYEELVEYAEEKDHHIKEVLYRTSPLRKKPDVKIAAKILMECQDMAWNPKKRYGSPGLCMEITLDKESKECALPFVSAEKKTQNRPYTGCIDLDILPQQDDDGWSPGDIV